MARSSSSKYAEVNAQLPRLLSNEVPAYQDKVEMEKAALRQAVASIDENNRDAFARLVAKRYAQLRAEKNDLEDKVDTVNLEIEACAQLLIESQEQGAEGWGEYGSPSTTLRLINGDTIRVQPEPYTVAEDKDVLREYFMDPQRDLSRLLAPPWQTVNALNKDRLLNGETEIPGTKIYLKTKSVYTATKAESLKGEL